MVQTRMFLVLFCVLIFFAKIDSQKYSYKHFDIKNGLSQMKVSSICEDSLGYIWFGTRNGLNRYNGEQIDVFTIENGLPNNRILDIIVDPWNTLIILTSNGLSFYNGISFKNYEKNFPRVDYNIFLKEGSVMISDLVNNWQFYNDTYTQLDSVINASNFNELAIDQIKKTKNRISFEVVNSRDSIIDSNVEKIVRPCTWFKDKQNNYWIGSDNGVHLFEPNMFCHYNYKTLPSIWSIEELNDSLWFASYGSGLYRMNIDKPNEIIKVNDDISLSNYHQGIAIDRNKNLYFSNAHCLLKYHKGNYKKIRPNNPSFSVTYDKMRSKMVCGILGGFMILNEEDQYKIMVDSSRVHKNNYIMNVTLDDQGNYWLGSYKGLTRYNLDLDKSEFFLKKNNKLPSGEGVYSGCLDQYKNLWFGGDDCLMLFSEKSNTLECVESQLLKNQVKAILEIDSLRMLVNTKDQLVVFNHYQYLTTGKVETYFLNESNSYQGFEPGYDGLFKDSKDNVWIMSGGSVEKLEIDKIKLPPQELSVKITKVNDQNTSVLLNKFNITDTILIDNETTVSFEIDAIGKVRSNNLLYRFKMENNQWSNWSESSKFQVKNVSHGVHLISVEVGPTDAVVNKQVDSIFINVKLDLYKRAFFIPLIFGGLIIALLTICFFIFKSRMERKRYLGQLEESRYLKSQLLLSEMNPHFIFNVLASIQNKILIGDKESANSKLIQLSTLMRNFLLTSYKSNQGKKHLENEITIKREIELLTSYLEFEKSNSNNQFTYSIEYNSILDVEQIMIPPMIIQPYVENAVKHGILPKGSNGTIKVTFELFSDKLICRIIDDGVGYNKDLKTSKPNKSHKSLGSKLVSERVKLLNELGYKIFIDSKSSINCGTEVIIKIYDKFYLWN